MHATGVTLVGAVPIAAPADEKTSFNGVSGASFIPKMIAAMLIAKAPKLYGFRDVKPKSPHSYEYFYAPGGTDLYILADHLGISRSRLKTLNPELVKGFIPSFVQNHKIRIPPGFTVKVSKLIREKKI